MAVIGVTSFLPRNDLEDFSILQVDVQSILQRNRTPHDLIAVIGVVDDESGTQGLHVVPICRSDRSKKKYTLNGFMRR